MTERVTGCEPNAFLSFWLRIYAFVSTYLYLYIHIKKERERETISLFLLQLDWLVLLLSYSKRGVFWWPTHTHTHSADIVCLSTRDCVAMGNLPGWLSSTVDLTWRCVNWMNRQHSKRREKIPSKNKTKQKKFVFFDSDRRTFLSSPAGFFPDSSNQPTPPFSPSDVSKCQRPAPVFLIFKKKTSRQDRSSRSQVYPSVDR